MRRTDQVGGLFAGAAEFGIEAKDVGRNAQFVVALYPREQSATHFQLGAGIGKSHFFFSSPGGDADGEGTGPFLSALFGTNWKMFYFGAGARFRRVGIN